MTPYTTFCRTDLLATHSLTSFFLLPSLPPSLPLLLGTAPCQALCWVLCTGACLPPRTCKLIPAECPHLSNQLPQLFGSWESQHRVLQQWAEARSLLTVQSSTETERALEERGQLVEGWMDGAQLWPGCNRENKGTFTPLSLALSCP